MKILGSLFITVSGIMMIIKPMKVWEFTYSRKTEKPKPTKYYLGMLRIGGLVLFAGGISALISLI